MTYGFKVKELFHATVQDRGIEDKYYDNISYFETFEQARLYYLKVYKQNYYTGLERYNTHNEKWQNVYFTCLSNNAKPYRQKMTGYTKEEMMEKLKLNPTMHKKALDKLTYRKLMEAMSFCKEDWVHEEQFG